jgi:hypothetical protein
MAWALDCEQQEGSLERLRTDLPYVRMEIDGRECPLGESSLIFSICSTGTKLISFNHCPPLLHTLGELLYDYRRASLIHTSLVVRTVVVIYISVWVSILFWLGGVKRKFRASTRVTERNERDLAQNKKHQQ